MGLIITPQEQIDAYFASPALSQSKLKELQFGLDKFLATQRKREETDDSDKIHFLFGGAVDTILTGEEDDFNKNYYVSTLVKKPSDAEVAIIDFVFEQILNNVSANIEEMQNLENYTGFIQAAVDFYNWQPKWKTETRINKIIDVGSVYFEDLKAASGKKVLSMTQFETIQTVVNSFRTNERTAKYFDRKTIKNLQNVDVYYQLPIYFTLNEVSCKALLDFLIVRKDSSGKVVSIQPFDIKTKSGFTIDFASSAKTFRYDIQGAWYSDALLNKTAVFPLGFPDLPEDVMLKPFTFIVESSTNPGKPLIFQSNQEFLDTGRNGSYNPATGKCYHKGYLTLLNNFIYHTETGWIEEEIVAKNDGVLELGWDGITEIYEH